VATSGILPKLLRIRFRPVKEIAMLVPHIILVMNGAAVACRTLEILKADASDAGSRQSRDPV